MIIDLVSSLVYVLLILTGIALFLSILNLLTLRDLSSRIRKIRDASPQLNSETEKFSQTKSLESAMFPKREERVAGPVAGKGGITSGIDMIAAKYHLDSLVIASRDGLLVASAGSSDAESEAAYAADLLSRKTVNTEHGVRLIEFAYGGMSLLGILRGKNLPSDEAEEQMKVDIRTVFDSQLGRNDGIFGEII